MPNWFSQPNWFYQQTSSFAPHWLTALTNKIDKIQPWNLNLIVQNESTISLPRSSDSPGCTLGDSTKGKMELSQKARVRKAKWNTYQRVPRLCNSRSQPWKGVCRPQSQNQMPTIHGGTSGFSFFQQKSLHNTDHQQSTFHMQSTGCRKCTYMHTHTLRSSTSTKDFPLDNSEEGFSLAWQKNTVFLGIKEPSKGNSDLNQSSENRMSCWGKTIFRYSVIYFPWSFIYTLHFKREILKYYCFETNKYTFQCITSISYLLGSLHKKGGIKFSIYGDRELHKGWVICPGLQVNQWQGQNKVSWLRGTCCQHKAMPPSSCAPWSQA